MDRRYSEGFAEVVAKEQMFRDLGLRDLRGVLERLTEDGWGESSAFGAGYLAALRVLVVELMDEAIYRNGIE